MMTIILDITCRYIFWYEICTYTICCILYCTSYGVWIL